MISNNNLNMDLIDVSGLCTGESLNFIAANTLANPPVVGTNYWIQMYIPTTLPVPPQKPDIEEVNSISVSVNIMRQKVVVTPNSNGVDNLEGKQLTGRKLIIEGELCQKVVYTACDEEQSVHSAHFYVPFSAFIVVPETVTFPNGETKDSLYVSYLVSVCVEDVYVKRYTCREIFQNVTLLLQAVPSSGC